MRKLFFVALIFIFIVNFLSGCKPKEKETLVIYSYDSFISYGLPEVTNKLFEDKYNCKVEYRSFGGVDATLNRLILEKNVPQADLFVGLNMNELQKAFNEDLFIAYKPESAKIIAEEYVVDKTWRVIPFDGPNSLAILYDSEKLLNPPRSFNDLLRDEYKNKLILEDPRTSSPGLGFLLWTVAVFGEDNYSNYWRELRNNIFHVYPEWESAFEAFKNGEAPMMISYDLDPAYFYYDSQTTRYKAVVLEEGGWLQLEFASIVKNSKHIDLAKKYIEFMLSEEFQKEIPLHQWTYPINKTVALPECFNYATPANKFITLSPEDIQNKSENWIKEWVNIMIQ